MPRWSPFRLISPAGAAGRLSTFIFHRVLPQPDPLLPDEPDVQQFERIVAFLGRHFTVLPLSQAAARLRDGRLPAAAACITFDDGYADNYTQAAPILQRHGLCATFFIATGYIDGGRMWNDTVIEALRTLPAGRVDWQAHGAGAWHIGGPSDSAGAASRVRAYSAALKQLKHLDPPQRQHAAQAIGQSAGLPAHSSLMMTHQQVRGLHAMGMEIGGHTISHPILRRLDAAQARHEIGAGREQLAAWIGEAPQVFAYPNGVPGQDYDQRDVDLVRAVGFAAAVSTAKGVATRGCDRLQLPRFTPWDQPMPRFALRCAANLVQGGRPSVAPGARTA